MYPSEFAAKWSESTAKESAGAMEPFIDACRMLGYATPNQAEPDRRAPGQVLAEPSR